MKNFILFSVAFLVGLILVPDLNAQIDKGHPTSLYSYYGSTMGVKYTSTQPSTGPAPFNINSILDIWVHCGEMEGNDKVYRTNLDLPMPTTQPSSSFYELAETYKDCDHFYLTTSPSSGLNGDAYAYKKLGDPNTTREHIGKLSINQDINGVITLNDGKKLLLITDKLPEDILIVREL